MSRRKAEGDPTTRNTRRWLTGDRIGVALIWLVIVASLCFLAWFAWSVVRPAT
ncbi:MAG TPA: hypothetical protein VLK34_03665 [Nocardioidaceae bacterium]|nr:hypothetical protein [Nocardioidaceae bacterium]